METCQATRHAVSHGDSGAHSPERCEQVTQTLVEPLSIGDTPRTDVARQTSSELRFRLGPSMAVYTAPQWHQ